LVSCRRRTVTAREGMKNPSQTSPSNNPTIFGIV
jgi:hypothetical protein